MKSTPYFLASMALVIAFLIWRLSVVNRKLDSSNSALTEKSDSIRYFRSAIGKQVAVKSAAEVTKEDLKEHYQDLAAKLKDMEVKISSIRAVSESSIEATGEGTVIIIRDTIRLPGHIPFIQDSVFIDDSYLKLRAQIIPGTRDSYLAYRYTYQDTIVMSISGKKKWLLGKETLIGSARLSNPSANVTNMTSILVKQPRDKRFVLSVGVIYDPFSNRFAPGLSCGYALLKF